MRASSLRSIPFFLLSSAVAACDPGVGMTISVAPAPGVPSDSIRQQAFVSAEAVAARYGLSAPADERDTKERGWDRCFEHANLSLCGKTTDRDIEFMLSETFRFQLTPRADSLARDIMSTLRARFGPAMVQECKWKAARDPRASACAQPIRRDST